MIRRFYLRNEIGQSYSLNSVNRGFLMDPAGLGYELDYSYAAIGAKWKANYIRDRQALITGTVIIGTSDPYIAEQELLNFIRISKNVVFVKETSVGTYYKDVDIVSYGKTEIGNGHVLHCPISFIAKSLWYTPTTTRIVINVPTEDEKRYTYSYPYTYNDLFYNDISVLNDGSVEASITADFYGPIVNPAITISVEGMEDRKVEIVGEAGEGEHIVYSSVDGNLYVNLKEGEQVTNLADKLDINNENFIKLPIGESRVAVSADFAITEPIILTFYKYYRAI